MKSAAFDYAEATSVAHALALMAAHGEGARLIAGGQSLLPAMNLRMAAPDILIDIGGLPELHGITETGGGLRIGAGTRHAEILASPLIAKRCPMLAEAMHFVAHPAIRNRGTLGGNLAHADPASEMPAVMLALDATMIAVSPSGERRIAAEDFFLGIYETALEPGEILVAIEIPVPRPGQQVGFAELARRHGDYALAGLAACLRLGADGAIEAARLGFFGVGDRAMLAKTAAASLTGRPITPETLAIARAALADDLDPPGDLHASAALRLHLAGVLLERVLTSLVPDGTGPLTRHIA
jgi:aerobic carbon-monoxide dehydrogenase medium subunit